MTELHEIRAQSPRAIPGLSMRKLWRLVLSGRVKSPRSSSLDLYQWKKRLRREGLSATLRFELRKLLEPQVVLKKPFHWGDDGLSTDEPVRIKQLVDWELVLAADHVHSTLRNLTDENWKSAQPDLLDDFQQLLRDALDLLCELGEADDRDLSHWHLPSIKPHRQNRGFRDWVILIELLRDAWLAVHATDKERATRIAQVWFEFPYPTFKRLAFFAASYDECIPSEQWVTWLLADNAYWLWSLNTRREVLRLFVQQGGQLSGTSKKNLEAAILAGPPHNDLNAESLAHLIWLRLAKLKTSGLSLETATASRLHELSISYPEWRLATNESDEFSHWMSGTGDPDFEMRKDVNITPRKRKELVQWLKIPPFEKSSFYEDTWHDVCRKHPLNSLFALADLAAQEVWPADRWKDALYVWSNRKKIRRIWHYAAPYVQGMSDTFIQEIVHAATWWMSVVSKSTNHYEDILLDLCRRVLALPLEADTGIMQNGEPIDEPVNEAINHPVGHITQTIINLWLKQNPNDNDLLPVNIKPLFTQLCDVQIDRFRHGRVLLGSRLIALFRVDPLWVEDSLLPLLNWNNPIEAKAMWQGFLWSPRLYQPLLIAFKPHFIETANHYAELGEHQQQFATFLTYAALNSIDGYVEEDFRSAIGALPQEGLEESAQALLQSLEGAADQCEDYWKNRIQPFWQQIWPKVRHLGTPHMAESLSHMAIAARGEFPAALDAVVNWLKPIEYLYHVVRPLNESDLCSRFPAQTLLLLDAVIADQQWVPDELGQCLDKIIRAEPQHSQDPQYQRIRDYVRRNGG